MDYAEANQRNFHEYWMQLMSEAPVPPAPSAPAVTAPAKVEVK
jgi:hypothetical protein